MKTIILDTIQAYFEQAGYLHVYLLTVAYFLSIYFGMAWLYAQIAHFGVKIKLLDNIVTSKAGQSQTLQERKNSIVSILIFGFSSFPVIYIYRNTGHQFPENSLENVVIGLLVLNIWNEIHFYVSHRLLHTPWLLRHVHVIHHRSVIPSVWSVYSFHWFEALLLSTVPSTLVLFYPVAPIAIALYPLNSLLFNLIGHGNVKLRKGFLKNWKMASLHSQHHQKFKAPFGFTLPFFDQLFNQHHTNQK